MAYINVAEWTPDQVTDWLKGLDDSMYSYVHSFTNNEVGGRQLLNIRPYELEQLGMYKIGHQEIVLEAVEHLRNFHYNLDKENLQFMALHLASAARSLHRQLATHCDASNIETLILNDITRTIGTIKPLISWLDRSPFHGQVQFNEIRRNMLRLGLEMATIAQRDRFVEKPVEQIRNTAEKLERLANYIIQDISDPMLLQPASLNLVTIKKRESELGFNIESSYRGIHRVTEIKYNSPAHNSGKIEDGDEIVQINYQTVVGWQYKTVLLQLRELLPDVLLTLKKRPKHTKIYGQIYMQPYRLPSKKRVMGSRWGENLSSPRTSFLAVPDSTHFNTTLKSEEKLTTTASDSDSSCSDILTPTCGKDNVTGKEIRLYYPKPRAMLQRRNTICGDELIGMKGTSGVMPLWHKRKTGGVSELPSSPSLRDKSISFGFGLEIAPRPTTCIGIVKRLRQTSEMAREVKVTNLEMAEKSKPGVSKVVRFDANMKYEGYPLDEKYMCNVENTILETFEPIPFADEEEDDVVSTVCESLQKSEFNKNPITKIDSTSKIKVNMPTVEAINIPMIMRRGRLDKSHSTPAYDNSGEDSDTPPAIEPRKEFLIQTPPIPPPRPRKQKDLISVAVPPPPPPPPKPQNLLLKSEQITTQVQSQGCILATKGCDGNITEFAGIISVIDGNDTESELRTPAKSRTLTLKKKNSLISKRRNVNLKLLGTGDIQGYLYRRTKDHRGVTFWARLYFVMLDTILYGFRSKEASKSNCIIFLPGFTVSVAKEVHSKTYAFKVYHTAKTFYFATDSEDALNQWIEYIRQATLQSSSIQTTTCFGNNTLGSINFEDLFSETDSTDDESNFAIENLNTPALHNLNDNNNASVTSSSPTITTLNSTSTNVKQDRRYLGSLRKLTKSTLVFKSSANSEKMIPVPTDQYRSYRKVPGGSFGIQIGTNTPGFYEATSLVQKQTNEDISSGIVEKQAIQKNRKLSISSSHSSIVSNGETTSISTNMTSPSSPALMNAKNSVIPPNTPSSCSREESIDDLDNQCIKKFAYNFIHASNPNLVEFDFQTSKTLDYSLPKINPSNSWDSHQNIQGFVTLKDLMLQKQEEEGKEMYNNRVLLGVEKHDINSQRMKGKQRHIEIRKFDENEMNNKRQILMATLGGKVKTQNRSLPKTPDYEISFKPDDEDIKRTRTKEGLKLRDFGYELISGDEPLHGTNCTKPSIEQQQYSSEHGNHYSGSSRNASRSQALFFSSHKARKQSNSNSLSVELGHPSVSASAGINEKSTLSFKKKLSKFDAIKISSEQLLPFNNNNKHSTTAAGGGIMTLPLKKRFNRIGSDASGGSIKKSHTYNNGLRDKPCGGKYETHRKNSAPIQLFSRFAFASSSINATISNVNTNVAVIKMPTEQRDMGSPQSRRSIFGSNNSPLQHHKSLISSHLATNCKEREYDKEIFSTVIFPNVLKHHQHQNNSERPCYVKEYSITPPNVKAPPPPPPLASTIHKQHDEKSCISAVDIRNSAVITAEYPDMECPPIFEPGTYSLTDTDATLNLMLRRSRNSLAVEEANVNIKNEEDIEKK